MKENPQENKLKGASKKVGTGLAIAVGMIFTFTLMFVLFCLFLTLTLGLLFSLLMANVEGFSLYVALLDLITILGIYLIYRTDVFRTSLKIAIDEMKKYGRF